MTTKALIEELHRLVDSVDDVVLSKKAYDRLIGEEERGKPTWWDTLTDEQHEELERAEEEIKDPNNLIDHKDAMENARQFLKKDNNGDWWNQLEKP